MVFRLALLPGTHQVQAMFGGFGDYAPSSSEWACPGVSVGITTTLGPSSSLNPSAHTEAATITKLVQPAGGAAVSGGMVTIVDAFDGSTVAAGPVQLVYRHAVLK